jgi:hypothetical protein
MKNRKVLLLAFSTITTLSLAMFSLFFLNSPGETAPSSSNLLSREESIQKAEYRARLFGLEGTPTAIYSRSTTLENYLDLIGSGHLGSDAAKYGRTPDMPVWVVVFLGRVEYSGPGGLPDSNGEYSRPVFDNFVVVIGADSGDLVATRNFKDGVPQGILTFLQSQ